MHVSMQTHWFQLDLAARSRQGTWAAALQTALLMGTALATLGALPLLFLTASWYLSMAAPTESPSSLETAWRKPESEARGDGRPPVMTLSQRLLPGTRFKCTSFCTPADVFLSCLLACQRQAWSRQPGPHAPWTMMMQS